MGSQHIHLCRILDGSFSENDLVEIEIEKEIGMDDVRRQLHNESVMAQMKTI